jgi:hypothetical protein
MTHIDIRCIIVMLNEMIKKITHILTKTIFLNNLKPGSAEDTRSIRDYPVKPKAPMVKLLFPVI